MPWIQLAIAAVFFVVGELLRPKPKYEDAASTPFAEARLPSVDPQEKQPVIYGKVDLRASHVMDVSEYNPLPIKKKISTSMFSSEKVIVGYRYFVGMQFGLASQIDTLHKIWYDERELIAGTFNHADAGTLIAVNLPDFLGGREKGGGVIGNFRFYGGSATQQPNTYLGAFQNPNLAYRWTSHVVLENVEVGESPTLDGFGFQVSRYPNPLGLGASNKIGVDLNPASAIVDLMTNQDYGYGLTLADIDTTSFNAAAATLSTEGNGISMKWVNNESVSSILETIARQIDGLLRYNPQTAKWQLKLNRNDYTVGTLLVLNESNIKELTNYSRASWDETINQVEVNYSQLDSVESPAPAMAEDRSNFVRQNRNKIQSSTFPACYSKTTANLLAGRELYKGAFPLSQVEIICNRAAWGLLPGDPFVLNWDELGIVQVVYRVASIGFGDDVNLDIQITAIEDIFKISEAIFSAPPASLWTPNAAAPVQITTQAMIDSPYFFTKRDSSATITTALKPLTLAAAPQANSLNYQIYARPGALPYLAENFADFVPTGTLNAAILERDGSTTADKITTVVVNNVSRPGLISLTTKTAAELKASGENLIYIVHPTLESEVLSFESVSVNGSTVTLTNVHRGLLDTLPRAHAIAARVWFLSGASLPGPGTTATEYANLAVVQAQYENRTQQGVGTLSTALSITMRNRPNRYYPGGNFAINAIRYPIVNGALNATITISFYHRDRTKSDYFFQDDISTAGWDKETGSEYVLKIYNAIGPTLVRTVRASGGNDTFTADAVGAQVNYSYTLAKQQADGGTYPQYQFVLTTQDVATGLVTNICDVIRVFNVYVAASLVGRGPIYFGYAQQGPTAAYPVNSQVAPYTGIGIGLSNGTNSTLVGNHGPGPDPLSYSVFTPGSVGNAVDIPSAGAVFPTASYAINCWFKIVQDAQTDRAILIKDTADAAATRSYAIRITGSGLLITDRTATAMVTQANAPALTFEDGKWHHLIWSHFSGSEHGLFVDGQLLLTGTSDATIPGTNTDNLRIGATTTGTQLGYARQFFSMLGLWTAGGLDMAKIQSIFANSVPASYGRMRMMLSYAGLKIFWRGNVGTTINPSGIVNLAETTAGGANNFQPAFTGGDWLSIGNTSVISGGNQLATTVEDDPGYRAFSCVNGSFPLHLRAPNDFLNGGTASGTGFKAFSFICIYKPNVTPTEPHGLLGVTGNSEESAQNIVRINIETSGKIKLHQILSSGNSRTWETTNVCIPTFGGITYHIVVTNVASTGKKIYVNGVSFAITEVTAGTPPATDDWLNNRGSDVTTKQVQMMSGGPLGNSESRGEIAEWAYVEGTALTADEVLMNWLGILRMFPTFKDEVLWSYPENMFAVTDYATQTDLRGAITGTATVTGVLPTDEEVGIPSDDYSKPARFSATQNLRYTSAQFLASKGTGVFHDFSVMAVLQMSAVALDQTLFCNTPAGGASANRNFAMLYKTSNTSVQFETSDAIVGTAITVARYEPACIIFTEKTAGGNAHEYWRHALQASTAAGIAAYTGAAVAESMIGARGGPANPLDGVVQYIAAWPHVITSKLIKRIQLRYRGMVGAVLKIHEFINPATPDSVTGVIFPMDDAASMSNYENYVVNDQAGLGWLTRVNGPIALARTPNFVGHSRVAKFLSASSQYADMPARTTAGQSVWSMGGWFRVDAGTDAFFGQGTLSTTSTQTYFGVGISGLRANFRSAIGAAVVSESGTTVLAVGTWYHIVMVETSITDRKLYINGVLEASFTVSRNLPGASYPLMSVNWVHGPDLVFDASYHMLWAMSLKALAIDEIRAIYAASFQDTTWQIARQFGATSYIPFDDTNSPTLKFVDRVVNSYNVVGTGVVYPAVPIIPNRMNQAVQFDGTGNVNTNWKGYPITATVRTFACWISSGFTGTVFSMGANVDAQALVVSIDASGDVSINIRGAGNLRKYTASFDSTGVHHLCVVQTVDSLYDFKVYQDGVDQTSIGTAGTDTVLATVATLALTLGSDVTDIATGDATGFMAGFTTYPTALAAGDVVLQNQAGRAKHPGIS